MKYLTTIIVCCLLCGCATWQDNAGKTLVTIAQTVDVAMKGWETYSVKAGIADNDPIELKVKAYYIKYQAAFEAARMAYSGAVVSKNESIWTQALTSLTASQNALLNVIQQFENNP